MLINHKNPLVFTCSFLHQNNINVSPIIMLPNNQGKLPIININPGPYDYKLLFEGNYYPHSINLSKLTFIVRHQGQQFKKTLFLTTGHSLADSTYMSDFGCVIKRTGNFADLFFSPDNLFYSVDSEFNDFGLISFGSYNVSDSNQLSFLNKTFNVNSIYKNPNIKSLELDMLIKNGRNTGESFAQAVIDFSYDPFIYTNSNRQNFYTFKIAGRIVLVSTPIAAGLIVKGRESTLTKYNGNPIDFNEQNTHLQYHFFNTIKAFKSHDIFNGFTIDDTIKCYFNKYTANHKLSVLSLMGDSGSGFYKLANNSQLELIGINIGSCYMIVLGTHGKYNSNKSIYYDDEFDKLVIGQYYIDEVHKASQILPISTIETYIKNIPGSIVEDIQI